MNIQKTGHPDINNAEVLFVLTINGTLPFVFPMGIIDLMNRIDAPKLGLLAKEVTAENVRWAKIIAMAIHWFYSIEEVLILSEKFKSINPRVSIVVGGYAATLFHKQLIKTDHIDYIVRGDAEGPFPLLVESLLTGRSTDQIPNLTKKGIANPIGYSISESEFSQGDYRNIDWFPAIKKIVSRMQKARMVNYIYPWIPVTRGCLMECRDCLGAPNIQRKLFGRAPVLRPAEAIRGDLLYFSKRPDINWCHFNTDFISMLGLEKAKKIFREAPYQLNCYYEFYRLPTLESIMLLSKSFSSVTISFMANFEGNCVNKVMDYTSTASSKLKGLLSTLKTFKNIDMLVHVDQSLARRSPEYAQTIVEITKKSNIHLLQIDSEEYPAVGSLKDDDIDELYGQMLTKIKKELPRIRMQQFIIENSYRYSPGVLRMLFMIRDLTLRYYCKKLA